jgi:hypothetical protein
MTMLTLPLANRLIICRIHQSFFVVFSSLSKEASELQIALLREQWRTSSLVEICIFKIHIPQEALENQFVAPN